MGPAVSQVGPNHTVIAGPIRLDIANLGWPEVQSGAVGVDEGCDAIRESRLAAGRPGGHAEQVAGPRAKREREMDEARRVFGLPPAKKPARELRTYGFGGSVTASR